jgi:peptidoglycan/xylan/chitin deacetylase (PgdA/CDA1 family)
MWPTGMQSTVVLTFDFDAEEVWTSAGPEFDRPGNRSIGAYGAKVGVPLILTLLADLELKATFFIPGRVCERHRHRVEEILEAGHEVALHGYTHSNPAQQPLDVQRMEFEKSLAILADLGVKPTGYRSPSWDFSDDTLRLLQEYRIRYSSNFMDDMRPYLHAGSEVVEMPVQWMLDDAPHFWFSLAYWNKKISTPSEVLEIWTGEFDGIHALGGSFVLTMHPQVIGRPSRLAMLRRMLEHICEQKGVWFATAAQAAEQARPSLEGSPMSSSSAAG